MKLAEFIDRELRELPLPRAPQTLVPRVLAAVDLWMRRPWYARAWLTWPLGWQAMSIATCAVLLAAGVTWLPDAQSVVSTAPPTVAATSAVAGVAATVERGLVTTKAALVVGRTLVEFVVPYLFALVILMCLACAAFGTALTRVALGRT